MSSPRHPYPECVTQNNVQSRNTSPVRKCSLTTLYSKVDLSELSIGFTNLSVCLSASPKTTIKQMLQARGLEIDKY